MFPVKSEGKENDITAVNRDFTKKPFYFIYGNLFRSMKRGIEPKLEPIETENDQRLRHCELHEQLSK